MSNTGSECGNIKNNLSSKSENEQIQYRTQGVHEDDRHLPGPSPWCRTYILSQRRRFLSPERNRGTSTKRAAGLGRKLETEDICIH